MQIQGYCNRHSSQAASPVLEAIAERNALTFASEGDLAKAVVHLRRCRNLGKAGGNTTLEADTCRRLWSAFAEIAAQVGVQTDGQIPSSTEDLIGDDARGNNACMDTPLEMTPNETEASNQQLSFGLFASHKTGRLDVCQRHSGPIRLRCLRPCRDL